MKMRALFVAGMLILIAGCGSTPPPQSQQWTKGPTGVDVAVEVTPDEDQEPLKNIMILAMMKKQTAREATEDAAAARIQSAGVGAIPAYQSLSPGQEITREFLEDQLQDTGVEALLILRVRDISHEPAAPTNPDIPPPMEPSPQSDTLGGRDLWGYFDAVNNTMAAPEFQVVNETVEVVVRIFRVEDASELFNARMKVMNPNTRTNAVNEIADQVLEQLKREEII